MAQQNDQQQPSVTTTFTGGMVKDLISDYLNNKGINWYHLRNGTTCLPDGQVGGVSTEPGTLLCTTLPYTIIGVIPLAADQWCVFLTDNITSEIGIFTESLCSYTTLTGPQTCPAFSKNHLVIGASRRGYDCGFDVYWSTGGYNPDRFINTAKVPFIQIDTTPTGPCRTYVDTTVLDCEKLRLAPHFTIPCMKLAKSQGSGTLRNGQYQVAMRYAINEIPCTDFVALSPTMSLFDHNNLAGALKLTLSGTESTIFTEMEIVLISMVNFQVEARRIGVYSTSQSIIYIDDLDLTLEIVPIEIIPLNTPAIESSDAIYSLGAYLTRVGVREKPQPNYQPIANQIRVWWTCTEYDDRYYYRGGDEYGMNVGSMRDEVYAYYIRGIWSSGDKTASYSIPGLPAGTLPTFFFGGPSTGDTGVPVAYGRMAGYSSTELYDDRHPAVWGPLCGLPIMHHKFPDQTLHPVLTHFIGPIGSTPGKIRIMGVYMDNIQPFVDNNGVVIPDIVGYEILRAVRDGHKSVIAKGIVNHMRGATDEAGNIKSIYQNYPYDDIGPDRYLTTSQTIGTVGGTIDDWQTNQQTKIMDNIITFHSPDTTFQRPNLGGSGSLVLYQAVSGRSQGSFGIPYKHPKMKLLTDRASELGIAIGVIAILSEAMNTISGGGTNLQLSATQDVPMSTPMGMSAIAEGSLGVTGDAIYIAGVAANLVALTVLAPIKLKVIQNQIMTLINGLSPDIQFASQYDSHGFYDTPNFRSRDTYPVRDYMYIGGYLQTFAGYNVNNLYRNDYLALNIAGALPTLPLPLVDHSRFTLGQSTTYPGVIGGGTQGFGPFSAPIACYYASYKVPQPSQYGQVDSPKQIPISCVIPVNGVNPVTTPVLFGGDTYINRYTEKNPFFFFNDWMLGQPPDYPYDYTQYENVPYPRYWINNSKIYYDKWAFGPGSGASKNWHVDEQDIGTVILGIGLSFYLKGGYFYLFNNGVRDFYVESDVNVGYRDWEDDQSKRFYDPYGYTTLEYIFRSDIIKSDILYKYDYSLSASKFWNNYISWGKCLRRDYDPLLAFTCFSYYPRRLHYSLPQDEEMIQDNWRMFLPNNMKDLPSAVTAIKEINESGAIILLEDRPPVQILGIQTLPSSNGVEYTVGTGSLFNQPLASISNADQGLQYGSCQNRLSVINTPHGVFWVSRNTGKVFNYIGQDIQDITPGMKWHLSRYLPSQLLEQVPDYPLKDNPVAGIGVQCIYDNINEILYICKKDYKVLPEFTGVIQYNTITERFEYSYTTEFESIVTPVQLGNTNYFEDCSWTLSWDCKNKQWIGFHDFFPALNVPAKTHPLISNSLTDTGRSLWRMNSRTDLFCNYFGIQYDFEVGYALNTSSTTTTLQSVEYMIESFLYRPNSTDKFLQYDGGFSRAIVYNDEQNSGWLELNLKPWNNPYAAMNFPAPTTLGTAILYSRVEEKWRFNQFYDLTLDRGQFGLANVQAFNTDNNGYTFTLNNSYFDPLKNVFQRKRFRSRSNRVFLKKLAPGRNSLTLFFNNSKTQVSPR